jgi:RNA recognition motif-containing protein
MSDQSRLFIGQLPGDVTEQELNEHFSQHGEITDIFIPNSSKPRKIAFVTYANNKSLYAALAETNVTIRGMEVALTKALPKGSAPPPYGMSQAAPVQSTRLFLNGIPSKTSADDIREYFSEFGTITDVFYKTPNAFGFVTFDAESDMFKALARDPMIFKGVELKAEVAKPKPTRGGPGGGAPPVQYAPPQQSYMPQPAYAYPPPQGYHQAAAPPSVRNASGPNCRLFVGALSSSVTSEGLYAYFGQFGSIKDVFRPGGDHGTFAFVTYENPNSMFAALALDEHVVDGAELRVTEADPRPPKGGMAPAAPMAQQYGHPPPSRGPSSGKKEYRVFIGKIGTSVTDNDLREHFAQYGSVADVYRPGARRGGVGDFGFVIFESQQGMAKALAEVSHSVNGVELQVTRARERPSSSITPAAAAPPAQQQMTIDYSAYAPYGYATQSAQQVAAVAAYNPYVQVPGYPAMYSAADAAATYNAGATSSRGSSKSTRYSPY